MPKLIVPKQKGIIIPFEQPKETPKEVLNLAPTNLDILREQSRKIEMFSHDFNIKKGHLSINTDLDLYSSDMDCLPMSPYALSQLCGKIGVPVRYINKCIETGRLDLAHDNLTSWLQDYKSDMLIREYDGKVRGVLTSKYSVCDTPEIIDVVNDVVDVENYNIKGFFLNEERFHLRLVSKEMLPISNEDLFSGITIDSSDVGRSPVVVTFFIYKQVCTNGLVVSKGNGTLFHQKHIGITAEEFKDDLYKSLEVVAEVEKSVMNSIEVTRNTGLYNDLRSPEDIQTLINGIKNTTKLSEEHSKKVIDIMQNSYETNRWGMINAITEVAQEFSFERRLELERIAGSLLIA